MGEQWMKWAFLESVAKTVSKLLQKVGGTVSVGIGHLLFLAAASALFQALIGFVLARRFGRPLLAARRQVLWSCAFGACAALFNVSALGVFYLGGEVGPNVLILALSIVPGALIDWLCFGHRLVPRQWLAIAVFMAACYSILDFPTLGGLLALPPWVILSFAGMMLLAINQGITQAVKDVDMFVKNFWGGATTAAMSFAGLCAAGEAGLIAATAPPMGTLWLLSLLFAVITTLMWSFNLLSYKGGASIALKKFVMWGAYLVLATLASVPAFGEDLRPPKLLGIALFLAGFTLMDGKTWAFARARLTRSAISRGAA